MTQLSLEQRAGQLLTDLQTYLERRESELLLPLGTASDILVGALVSRIMEVSLPPNYTEEQLIAASNECTLRLSDVTFSMRDWFERKKPWRWQSSEMRERMADVVAEAAVVEIRPNGRLDS